MIDNTLQCFANDREIYDLLMSAKQKITEDVLHEIARTRGIFFSPKDSREDLAEKIAMLPHSSNDVASLIQRREHAKRAEKTTSITLRTDVGISEILSVVKEYQTNVKSSEIVRFNRSGANNIDVNVEYDEMDYSRTRLIQRQRKDSDISIVKQDGVLTIHMPANEKSRNIIETFKDKLESKTKSSIETDEIELSHLTDPQQRTEFFLNLIESIPGYRLLTVTSLRVASIPRKTQKKLLDIEVDEAEKKDDEVDEESAAESMLAEVQSASFNGRNLIASPEYRDLRNRGFFITGIKWRSEQTQRPYHQVMFDVDFENAQECKGFKYLVRFAPRLNKGNYSKNFQRMKNNEDAELFKILEAEARKILADITNCGSDVKEKV